MSDPTPNTPPKRIPFQVQVPSDLKATYANFALISHSASEIVLDFAQVLPQQPQARVQARVVMTPLNVKLLINALQENLSKYEAKYGEVHLPSQGSSLAQQLFNFPPPDSGDT